MTRSTDLRGDPALTDWVLHALVLLLLILLAALFSPLRVAAQRDRTSDTGLQAHTVVTSDASLPVAGATVPVGRAAIRAGETIASNGRNAMTGEAVTPADERGVEIAREADRRDSGFGDFSAGIVMILRNRQGDESTRRLRSRTLEGTDDGDRSLVVFDEPVDVKGMALLTWSHASGADDQWLYLPAIGRVKRIASNNRSGPFMGSEFAYEDIASQEVPKYAWKYIGEEIVEGTPMLVVERDPVDENSGYTRQVVWYDAAEYRPMKIDYYDRKNALLKTLTYSGYRQYAGKYWRADEMRMVNHQTGKSTVVKWSEYRFGAGLDERDFDQSSLKRAR